MDKATDYKEKAPRVIMVTVAYGRRSYEEVYKAIPPYGSIIEIEV